jgi:hypothetical protein
MRNPSLSRVFRRTPRSSKLVIKGGTFSSGARVFVFTDPLIELPVASVTASVLRATLTKALPTGTFLLIVYDPATFRYGAFSPTFRTGGHLLVDSNGQVIGEFDMPTSQVILTGTSHKPVRLVMSSAGIRGNFDPESLLHFDAACTSPHLHVSDESIFFDRSALTLANGASPSNPPFATAVWVPDRSKPLVSLSCSQQQNGFFRDGEGQCVAMAISCGDYRPAMPIDFSHFVPPFKIQ